MATMDELKLALRDLAASRNADKEAAQVVKTSRVAWEADNTPAIATAENWKDDVARLTIEVRALAVLLYDGENKDVAPGVSITDTRQVTYDKGAALDWAIEHKLAVLLDDKLFEQLAKLGVADDIVVGQTIAGVRIATDLTAALAADRG